MVWSVSLACRRLDIRIPATTDLSRNKRQMCHIAHLRKTLNQKTHMIIKMFINRRKSHYLLCENWMVFHFTKLESPSPNDVLCHILLILASDYGEENFRYFVFISAWKGAAPSIWTNLNPHHPMMHCAKFC